MESDPIHSVVEVGGEVGHLDAGIVLVGGPGAAFVELHVDDQQAVLVHLEDRGKLPEYARFDVGSVSSVSVSLLL